MEENYTEIKSGKIRGYKVKYSHGVLCTVSTTVEDDEKGIPLCYDFYGDNLKDVKYVVDKLCEIPADEYVPDPDYEKFKEEQEIKESKWWYKVMEALEDIGIHFTPFNWKFQSIFVTRPVPDSKNEGLNFKLCGGFYLGPFTITWMK